MVHTSEQGAVFQTGNALMNARVIDAGGRHASIVSFDQGAGEGMACVQSQDGMQVLVPLSLLALQDDGVYRLPFAFDAGSTSKLTLPVMEEALQVGKRLVDTGGVRIRKTVSERQQVVDEPLLRDELTVEHVPIDVLLAETDLPGTRYEGDTLIVPVLEEVLVVQKQFRLKEEVRITRRRHETHAPQTVVLRREQIDVERFDGGKEQA